MNSISRKPMKKYCPVFSLILIFVLSGCINSKEKTVHDTIYVSTQEAAELLNSNISTSDTLTESDRHYTMLNSPQPSQADRQESSRHKRSNRSESDQTLSYQRPSAPQADSWRNFTLSGSVHAGGQTFPFRVRGQVKESGGYMSFKNCKYTNVKLNITFGVNVSESGGFLSVVSTKGRDVLAIEAYRSGANTWDGSFSDKDHSYSVSLTMN